MCLDLLGATRGAVFNRGQIAEKIERIRELPVKINRSDRIDPQTELDRAKRTVNLTIAIGK